jgi:uncharacterized RDD family membrane protein YckC
MISARMTGYEDTRTIATPEGVELELPLAGIGSRAIGLLVDTLIESVVLVAAVVAALALGGITGAGIVAAFAVLLIIAYNVLFEVLGGGRTPGKRAAGLRVVMDGGAPVGLRASLIRNVFRLLEGVLLYVPAMIFVLATRNNQRAGDLAAGTLVIRDAPRETGAPAPEAPPPAETTASWDVSGVQDDELAVVRAFLARRAQLAPHARRELAQQLAAKLRPRVAGVRAGITDEAFLTGLAAAKGRQR